MRLTDEKHRNILIQLMAWGLIPLAFLALCVLTLSRGETVLMCIAMTIFVIAEVGYHIIRRRLMATERYRNVMTGIDAVIFIFILACIRGYGSILPEGKDPLIPLLCLMAAGLVRLAELVIVAKGITFKGLSELIGRRKWLILLIVAVWIMGFDENIYQFKWDGLLYYGATKAACISSIGSMALYGHLSMAVSMLWKVCSFVTGSLGYGMYLANMISLTAGTIAFYGIVRKLCSGCREGVYIAMTAVYAFSPFTLGMTGYYSLDYYTITLVTILIYFIITDNIVGTVPAAVVFLFTKEPALITYGGLCLGLVLAQWMKSRESFAVKARAILTEKKYYFMLIPIIMWLGTFRILGGWSAGNSSVGVDSAYVVRKLAVFFCFNFNWIFTLTLAVIFLLIIAKKLATEVMDGLLPLIVSNVCLLLFNCIFKTINHPRYIDSFIVIHMLLAMVMAVRSLQRGKDRSTAVASITGAVAMIVLMASFVSFDPVSILMFDDYGHGTGHMYSADKALVGDYGIYNKQMLWLEKGMSEAVGGVLRQNEIDDADTVIVIPTVYDQIYNVDGLTKKIRIKESVEMEEQYFDKDRNMRVSYCDELLDEDEIITYPVFYVRENVSLDETVAGIRDLGYSPNDITVIFIEGINDDLAYTESFGPDNVKREEGYEYRGWRILSRTYEVDTDTGGSLYSMQSE
ncbi:MAG: hypothetical protein K5662_02310 [Lachnospiraceae bacterium]|nr:hypothetical protein [Lachnospiraceae bacterium]